MSDERYTAEKVREASLSYFKGDALATSIFLDKYALKNKDENGDIYYEELTPDDMHKRMAKEFARIELKYPNPLSYEQIYKAFQQFNYIIPQGSPMYGVGNKNSIISLSNCIVTGSPEDSVSGIFNTARDTANLYKRRMGVGFDISTLRPDGANVNNSSGKSTGAWSFLDLYSYVCRLIAQNGRRGALMITMACNHPDIYEFASIKLDETKVSGANISVMITDEFMQAVESDSDYYLQFPVDVPLEHAVSYKKIKAKHLWEHIVECATKSGDPGIIFVDNYKNNLPANEYPEFKMVSTNPCQPYWAPVLTPNGIKQMGDIQIGEKVWSSEGWTKVIAKRSSGIKDVYKYKAQAGVLYSTDKHKVFQDGKKVEVCQAKFIDSLHADERVYETINNIVTVDSFLQKGLIAALDESLWLPNNILFGLNIRERVSFLRGYLSSRAEVVTYHSYPYIKVLNISEGMAEDIQLLLSSVGVPSYTVENFLYIEDDFGIFRKYIGFIQKSKNQKLLNTLEVHSAEPSSNDIVGEFHSTEEVFNIEVDNESKSYWSGGFNISNCSEIGLSAEDSCRLITIPVTSYVVNKHTSDAYFDFQKFEYYTRMAMRLIDDLVDLEIECIDEILAVVNSEDEKELWTKIKNAAVNGRRTGLGVTGLGDMLAMLQIKYDSPEACSFVEYLMNYFKEYAYSESINLAKERGPFPAFDWEKEKNNIFIKRLSESLQEQIKEIGRRNISLLTIAPNGSTSNLVGRSSGIEPPYMISYIRNKKINPNDENQTPDHVDKNGEKWKQFHVIHPTALEYLLLNPDKNKEWEEVKANTPKSKWDLELKKILPEWFVSAEEVNIEQRINLQAAAQVNVDHGISSCLLAGDSMIVTNEGLFDIEELSKGTPEKEFRSAGKDIFSINSNNEPGKIEATYNNGLAKTIKISCSGGHDITCTPNHRLLTLNKNYEQEWKYASDITNDDVLIGRIGLNLWNSSGNCLSKLVGKPFEYTRLGNSKEVTIPDRMTPELARLVGYMCSDAGIWKNGISLCQQKNNVGEDFAYLVKKLFNVEAKARPDIRSEGLENWIVNSREVKEFFTWIGITNHDIIEVPLAIRRSGKLCIKNFLKGVTLDGFVSENCIGVISSISKKYAKQIQQIILNLGIDASVYKCHNEDYHIFPNGKEYKTQDAWIVRLPIVEAAKFVNQIGFAEDRKNQEAISKLKRSSRIKIAGEIPDYGLRLKFKNEVLRQIKSNRLYEFFNSMTGVSKQGMWLSRESLLEMKDMGFDIPEFLTDKTFVFRKVKTVEEGPIAQTYDLSVPEGNSYIANGIVSHNTLNRPKGTKPSEVSEIYFKAWKAGLKGVTVYVDGSKGNSVLSSLSTEAKLTERPKELSCDIHHPVVNGKKWTILIGLHDGKPYEVFGGLNEYLDFPKNIEKGTIIKTKDTNKKKSYNLILQNGTDKVLIDDIIETFDSDVYAHSTRLLSLLLRNGTPIHEIVDQLNKEDRGSNLYSFSKVIARELKRYIIEGSKSKEECPKCSDKLIFYQGCMTCNSCGYSKCN